MSKGKNFKIEHNNNMNIAELCKCITSRPILKVLLEDVENNPILNNEAAKDILNHFNDNYREDLIPLFIGKGLVSNLEKEIFAIQREFFTISDSEDRRILKEEIAEYKKDIDYIQDRLNVIWFK